MPETSPTYLLQPSFLRELRRLNDYPESVVWEWLFLPGMKFGDTVKWWGTGGTRERPHEGLDLLILLDERGNRHLLPPGTAIPPLLSGIEVARLPDFLGETVILAHDLLDKAGRRLHSFYAHLQPCACPASGTSVGTTNPVGIIAAPAGKSSTCPPHLHLSLAWVDSSFPIQDFRWARFCASETFRPDDPLIFLGRKI